MSCVAECVRRLPEACRRTLLPAAAISAELACGSDEETVLKWPVATWPPPMSSARHSPGPPPLWSLRVSCADSRLIASAHTASASKGAACIRLTGRRRVGVCVSADDSVRGTPGKCTVRTRIASARAPRSRTV